MPATDDERRAARRIQQHFGCKYQVALHYFRERINRSGISSNEDLFRRCAEAGLEKMVLRFGG